MIQTDRHFDFSEESILVVDDDDLLRVTVEQLLSALKFQTASSHSGLSALGMLSEKGYSFLLTDMKMPEMDGIELIRNVSKSFPDVSIIAMTGYSEGYKYLDVIKAGACDFIKKPFDLEELEAKIVRIITERNLRKELNRLSITDSLTGLYNQGYFFTRLKEEVLRSERQRHPLALIFFDIDDFKIYNDTYGHLAGDELLRSVGRQVNKSIREGVDLGFRYGGDEFAVVLIDADLAVAKEIGRRIQESFEKNKVLSACFGYAIFNEGMSAEDLVKAADKDLYDYKSKRKEINRVS